MDNLIEFVSNNPLLVAIVSLVMGVFINQVVSKVRNKTGTFLYTTTSNTIALSTNDLLFGTVKVTWQDQPVRNVHFVTINVINASSRDYDNVILRIVTDKETHLLNEHCYYKDTSYIIDKSKSFNDNVARAEEGPLQNYWHNREYEIPVFNRGQELSFSYLCTRPSDDLVPTVYPDMITKGATLKYEATEQLPLFGVPMLSATYCGWMIALLAVLLCGNLIQNPWLVSTVSMLVGLTATILGALIIKAGRYLRAIISG